MFIEIKKKKWWKLMKITCTLTVVLLCSETYFNFCYFWSQNRVFFLLIIFIFKYVPTNNVLRQWIGVLSYDRFSMAQQQSSSTLLLPIRALRTVFVSTTSRRSVENEFKSVERNTKSNGIRRNGLDLLVLKKKKYNWCFIIFNYTRLPIQWSTRSFFHVLKE